MANGIVIHIEAGAEKRSEFFTADKIRLGTEADCDLQFAPPNDEALTDDERGVWLELRRENGFYRVADFKQSLDFTINDAPLVARTKLRDGDSINISDAEISLSFFTVSNHKSAALTATNHGARQMRFIETAAIESASSPQRDDAKVFLREFVRELVREVSWRTKIIALLLIVATLSGLFYVGTSVADELQRSREVSEQQAAIINGLKDELAKNRDEIGNLDKKNQQLINIVSLAPTLRNEYGSGVCLLVGTYDLVDKRTGKQLRYPDPAAISTPETYEQQPSPQISESGTSPTSMEAEQQSPLTTEGYGTPVEFDFVGTGFHAGGGYIITNRHVVQPWAEDERVKVMAQMSNGRARLKKLVIYFPGLPNPIPMRVREVSVGEDLAVGSIDPNEALPRIPALPLDSDSDAGIIGKPVVSMGYPNGPDRILAMVDESEARSIQAKYGQSLQTLVNFLSQSKKISPLTTQGSITDLDAKRITHDAKTAEGGSGAPLFGASGKVIGVNFGVFTENTAANMAVPIKYVLPMLKRAGWTSPDEPPPVQTAESEKTDAKNSNSNVAQAKTPRN